MPVLERIKLRVAAPDAPAGTSAFMRRLTFTVAFLLFAAGAQAARPAPSDAEAQRAHAQGSCGKLGPGSGLKGGKGWVASMLPGRHEFRVKGGGDVYLTTARQRVGDFDAGRLYYIVVENARPGAVLEWKIPGSDWGAVSKYFLYPPQN